MGLHGLNTEESLFPAEAQKDLLLVLLPVAASCLGGSHQLCHVRIGLLFSVAFEVVVCWYLHARDSTAPHGLNHFLHDLGPPTSELRHLERYGSVGNPIPRDLLGVPDITVNVLLDRTIDIVVVVDN
jgi:hypothetical protein